MLVQSRTDILCCSVGVTFGDGFNIPVARSASPYSFEPASGAWPRRWAVRRKEIWTNDLKIWSEHLFTYLVGLDDEA